MDRLTPRLQTVTCFLTLLLLISVFGGQAYCAESNATKDPGQSSHASPKAVVIEFYRWYLGELAKNRNPLQDDHAKIETYVSKALIQELNRRTNSEEGLAEDYFIRAQDYLADWANNISVSGVHVEAATVSMSVTLGNNRRSRHHLSVILIKKGDAWKISKAS